MNIRYNVTGPERKALAGAISEILAVDAVYKGAPTFAYEIGGCTVDKDGTLICAETVADQTAERLITELKERGYTSETDTADSGVPEPVSIITAEASSAADSDDPCELVVEIPGEGFTAEAIENLKKIIASKDTLIKKALGAVRQPFHGACLAFEVKEDKLCFPWFTLSGTYGEADAYARFICALCEMAKTQKRVTAKERDVDNDKFTMRLFLVRLGLKGPENKAVRQIMLRNLTGNSSWKQGQPPEKAAEAEVNADASVKSEN